MINIEVSENRAQHQKNKPKNRYINLARQNLRTFLMTVLIIILIIFVYGYIHTRNQLKQLSNPSVATKNETQNLTSKVGKLVELPSGETPTIATVNNANKLKNQTFFKNAQNGDKLLIYNKAGQAILYRPSTNRVIQYSYINLNNSQ